MTGFGMRKFTEDFKREAVRLVQTSGRTIEQVADDLGIGRSTLGKWLAKHRDTDGQRCVNQGNMPSPA